jgi:CubicO group peptidase (beta-lactamase class C family)
MPSAEVPSAEVPSTELSGVAVVRRHGDVLLRRAAGVADVSSGRACTPDTRFQLCSVSKQFTAAAVLLLADSGRVTLDDPLPRWFGGCPQEWRQITVHHLLTHTAGLGHWRDCTGLDPCQRLARDQQMDLFKQMPMLSRPGERWSYSSPGYVLLGWIVQEASDQPYADFLADHIFGPLGLRSTSAGDWPSTPDVAHGYHAGQPVRSFDLAVTNIGTGNVWSTPDDLVRWDSALAAGELLTAQRRQQMLTPHAPISGETYGPLTVDGYGYGWFVGTAAGRPAYFHPGDNPGYLAFNGWLPDDDIQIAVLINDETTDRDRVVAELAELAGINKPGQRSADA